MSGRSRFKIPTGEEMEKPASDAPSINTMSKFQTYKQQKKDIPSITKLNSKTDSSKSPVKAHIKPSTNTAQKPVTVSNGVGEQTPSLFVGTKQTIAVNAKQQQTSKPVGNKPVPSSVVAKGENSTSEKISGNDTESTASGSSKAPSVNSIVVNFRQRGNPILKHIRNVPWEYGSIIPDYVMGKANCALFLSLRYHQLNPTYIHNRLKELGKGYDLRVLLVQVDVTEPHHLLKDLAKMCILADCTLIVAFTVEEAGRYLETYKVYENKPAEALMERIDTDYVSKLTDTLTSVRSVNKTDCMTLLSTFGSYDKMVKATKEELSLCPGFGPQKAQRLYDVFHEPFVKGRKRKKLETVSKGPQPSTSELNSPVKKPS